MTCGDNQHCSNQKFKGKMKKGTEQTQHSK